DELADAQRRVHGRIEDLRRLRELVRQEWQEEDAAHDGRQEEPNDEHERDRMALEAVADLRQAMRDLAQIYRARAQLRVDQQRVRNEEMRDLMAEVMGDGGELRREGERRLMDEMIREAQNLREQDESNPSTTRYSRLCFVCATENPRQRAVYIKCGHVVCYPCAVDNKRSEATGGKCMFCRSMSGFVKLFEEECGE
ncbi:hypothetical protein PENTCL1PPCAC_11068, partial [Pristionchus entomophagus]